MNGGTITGINKKYGGAVFVGNGATFTMNAGTITGCKAKYGGAIYVASGGTCNINGGIITGNKAENAPAIYVETGGVLNISEEAIVEDNIYLEWFNAKEEMSTGTMLVGSSKSDLYLHYIDFGSYPQTYVGNEMNETLENWYSVNSPTSVKTYEVRTRTWEAYEYIDGNIYVRGLSHIFSTVRSYSNGDTIIQEGLVAWFKVQQLRWFILNYEELTNMSSNEMILLSEKALVGDIYFNPSVSAGNKWESSFIRTWLNGTFYNDAFSNVERSHIKNSIVGNNTTGDYASSTSNQIALKTEDYVYLLSYWYFADPNGLFANNEYKMSVWCTDFAMSNYCYNYVKPEYGNCYQLLRSAGNDYNFVCSTGDYCRLIATKTIVCPESTIRPVIRIKTY